MENLFITARLIAIRYTSELDIWIPLYFRSNNALLAKGSQTESENLTPLEKNILEAGQEGQSAEAVPLELTPLEFDLLCTFMSYPGRVWNRAQIIEKLWDGDFFGDERVVDAHIARLRKKVEPNPAQPTFIKTVVGVGYRFEDDAGWACAI